MLTCKSDYILVSKLSEKPFAEFEYLNDFDGTGCHVHYHPFAAGLSGKFEAGDIVTLISANYDNLKKQPFH